jgi:ABC-type bacteriocin/lantibiotic exporter with double-glycine peptidase domain
MSDAAAQPAPPTLSSDDLSELLAELCALTDVDTDAGRIGDAVDRSPGFEEAASCLGLRVRWLVAPIDDAVALATPEVPLVTFPPDGGAWILNRTGPRGVYLTELHGLVFRRWAPRARLRKRLGRGGVPWAMIEPALPVAALASPGRPRSPLRRLLSLLWLERRDGLVVMLYGAVAGLLSLATPLAIQVLINWLAFGALLQPVFLLGGVLLTCLALAAGMQLLQRIAVETIERRIFVRTVADLSVRLARVQVSAFDGRHGPELANRFFDVLTLQKAASTLLLDGFTALLQVAVAVSLLGLYHPWLLLFDLILLLGMAMALIPLGFGAERTAIKESKAKYEMAAWIEEIARHPIALRMNDAQLAQRRAEQLARTWLERRRDHFRVFLRQYAGVQALQVTMSVVLLIACGALVLRGQLTVGQLVAAEFIVNTALVGFAKFADKLDTVYDLLAGVDKLGSLLDLPPEDPSGLPRMGEGPATGELDGATLTYDEGGTLPPIDLRLPSGSRTILYALPGTGKSTLAQLVTGIRFATGGIVRHDGVNVRQLRPEARYDGISLLRGDDLLHASVRDNVALGRPHLDDARVWKALRHVGLADRIERLSQGLDTIIDPKGLPLSEVELRALLVARAIACRPRLVVVDGVLDGLPASSRDQLRRLLMRPDAPWTLLVLTADARVPTTAARCYTLDAGGLSERPPLATA